MTLRPALALLCAASTAAMAGTYRIAPGTPFPDTAALVPGDSVLFERGAVFRAGIAATRSGLPGKPIHYGAYGTGPDPMFLGTIPVHGWKPFRGRIYTAAAGDALQLFCDGIPMRTARYPDHGYLDLGDPFSGDSLLLALPLGGMKDWRGAPVHVRSERFSLDARRVASVSADGRRVRLDRPANYPLRKGYGLFFNGVLAALDSPGEWASDSAIGSLYFWTPRGDPPARHRVEVSALARGFACAGQAHLEIESLGFSGFAETGIWLDSVRSVRVVRCRIDNPGREGIRLRGDSNRLDSNHVSGAPQGGIRIQGEGNVALANSIAATGLSGRLGREGFGGGCCRGDGLEAYGDSNRVEDNSITASGYHGIAFAGRGASIEGNWIDSACLTLDDGAGIDAWAADTNGGKLRGSRIRNNVILSCLGNAEGAPTRVFPANGIYLDENVSGVTVSGNVVADADIGIYLHNAPGNRVTGNLLYGNRSMQICLKRDYLDKAGMRGNIMESNSLVTTARSQDCLFQRRYGVPETDTLGTSVGNRCCEEDSSGARCRIDSARAWQRVSGKRSFLSLARGSKRLRLIANADRLLRREATASEAHADAARAGGRPLLVFPDSLALFPAP